MHGSTGRLRRCRVCDPGLSPDSSPFRPLPGGGGWPARRVRRGAMCRDCAGIKRENAGIARTRWNRGCARAGLGQVSGGWKLPRSGAEGTAAGNAPQAGRGPGQIAQTGCRGTPQGAEKGLRALTASSGLPGPIRGSAPNCVPPMLENWGRRVCRPDITEGPVGAGPPPPSLRPCARRGGGARARWVRSRRGARPLTLVRHSPSLGSGSGGLMVRPASDAPMEVSKRCGCCEKASSWPSGLR